MVQSFLHTTLAIRLDGSISSH